MRFMAMADVHLRSQQYNSKARGRDFARAFLGACRAAVKEECDLALIAGDLFHGTAGPQTFLQAVAALEELRAAGIKTLAIAGNHDRVLGSSDLNWLHVLDSLGLLEVLDLGFHRDQLKLGPFASFEAPNYRVVGIQYLGAGLPPLIPELAARLAELPRKYTILMLHAGIAGVLPHFAGTLSMGELECLRPHVQFLALGHIHKPFERDGWVFNPGSLETNAMDEAEWEERGYYVVDVDDPQLLRAHIRKVTSVKRPFGQIHYAMSSCRNPTAFHQDLEGLLRYDAEKGTYGTGAVMELRLEGTLQFDRSGLDLPRIRRFMEHTFQPLVCRIRDMTESTASEIVVGANLSRLELEHQVVHSLVVEDSEREPHADVWTEGVLDMRDRALLKEPADRIIEATRTLYHKTEEQPA